MVGCFILAASGLLLCDSVQKVDFESRAAPIASVLQSLSKQTGKPMRAVPAIAQEVVLVYAKGVELKELKARIAEAMQATWTVKEDAEYLSRTTEQATEIRKAHLQLRRGWVDLELSRIRKQLESPFDAAGLAAGLAKLPSEESVRDDPLAGRKRYEQERSLFASGPLARLLNRLVLACDPNDLAAVDRFSRAIFTLDPTMRQYRLRKREYDAAVAAFAKEQDAWREAAAKAVFPEESGGRMASDPRAQLHVDPAVPKQFRLAILRGEMAGLFMVNLMSRGNPEEGWSSATQGFFEDPSRRLLDSFIAAPPDTSKEPIVELSPDSKLIQDRMSQAFRGGEPSPLAPRVLEMLLDLPTNEPLGWMPSDILLAYAMRRGVNLVAVLPDQALSWSWFIAKQGPLKALGAVDQLVRSGNYTLKEAGTFVLIEPADRYEQMGESVSRAAISDLIRATHARGAVDAEEYATFAFRTGQPSRSNLGVHLLAFYDPSQTSAMDRTSWTALRLYGSISAIQRRSLENGGKLPFAGLSPAQREPVERIVYGDEIRSNNQVGMVERLMLGLAIEPSDRYPYGLPPSGAVSARTSRRPMVFAYGKGQDDKLRPLRSVEPQTLVSIELNVVGDPKKMANWGVASLAGYAIGEHKDIMLRVELEPGIWQEVSIVIPSYPANPLPVAWDKLPETYVKQIQRYMDDEQARKASQKKPPPPPTK